jgi:hypothetical protein
MAGRDRELNPGERRKRNEPFADRILDRWCDKGPASGHTLFRALLQKAVEGPIATPERARAILPTLLEVLDEMEEIETARHCGDESGVESQEVVPPARFQRATFRLGGGRSMQLSYGSTKR